MRRVEKARAAETVEETRRAIEKKENVGVTRDGRKVIGKNAQVVIDYAEGIINGEILANKDRIMAAKRFLRMLNDSRYEVIHHSFFAHSIHQIDSSHQNQSRNQHRLLSP